MLRIKKPLLTNFVILCWDSDLCVFYYQKVKASFPAAEQLKAKLKERYAAQEKKRREEEVGKTR